MKRRSVILAMAILAILAVALVIPTVASGKPATPPEKQPLNWVSWGGNSNNSGLPDGQIQSSVLVKELGESTVGHVLVNLIRFGGERHVERFFATEFVEWGGDPPSSFHPGPYLYVDPFTGAEYEFNGKIAEIVYVVHIEEGNLHFKWVLIDGGEPGAQKDKEIWYVWGPEWPELGGYPTWFPFFYPIADSYGIESGNIQVHLGADVD
jgi:hypothetical protein